MEDIVEGRGKRGPRPMSTIKYPRMATTRSGGLRRCSSREAQGLPESNETTGGAEIVTDCKLAIAHPDVSDPHGSDQSTIGRQG